MRLLNLDPLRESTKENENCSDGDTNEQQIVIGLGTKSEAKAELVIKKLVKIFNANEKIITKKKVRKYVD